MADLCVILLDDCTLKMNSKLTVSCSAWPWYLKKLYHYSKTNLEIIHFRGLWPPVLYLNSTPTFLLLRLLIQVDLTGHHRLRKSLTRRGKGTVAFTNFPYVLDLIVD